MANHERHNQANVKYLKSLNSCHFCFFKLGFNGNSTNATYTNIQNEMSMLECLSMAFICVSEQDVQMNVSANFEAFSEGEVASVKQ